MASSSKKLILIVAGIFLVAFSIAFAAYFYLRPLLVLNQSKNYKISDFKEESAKELISCLNEMLAKYPDVFKGDEEEFTRLVIQIDDSEEMANLLQNQDYVFSAHYKLEKHGSQAKIRAYLDPDIKERLSELETQVFLTHMLFYQVSNQFEFENYNTCINKLSPEPNASIESLPFTIVPR